MRMNASMNLLDNDIFNDIADDIIIEETYHDSIRTESVDEWFSYHQNHYSSTIYFSINYIHGILNIIDIITRRLEYLLNAYNIEHSEIFLKDATLSLSTNNMTMYDYDRYKIITTFRSDDSNSKELPDTYSSIMLNVVVYVNYPKFTYKQVYMFTQALMSITWKNKKLKYLSINSIWLNDTVLTYDEFYYSMITATNINSMHCIRLIQSYILYTFDTLEFDKQHCFINYFESVMSYFFKQDESLKKLLYKVKHGQNPFELETDKETDKEHIHFYEH